MFFIFYFSLLHIIMFSAANGNVDKIYYGSLGAVTLH